MPNFATASALVETATKWLATAASSPSRLEQPGASRVRVGQRLERREGLRGDDHERLLGVAGLQREREVGGIDVRDEVEAQLGGGVGAQGLVGHRRAEVRAADPDVDHVPDAPAGVPAPGAGAHALGEVAHLGEDGVDLRHDVLAVGHDRRALGRAQRDVEHRPVLGDVDVLAGEHRVGALAHTARLGERDEQPERLGRHAVLGVVQVQAAGLERHALPAVGVGAEELAQMQRRDLALVGGQRLPLGKIRQSGHTGTVR